MSRGIIKSPWLPGAATALAILSCYGTGLLIGVLSILGISVVLNERAWAGSISLFAALAALLIGASSWRRRVILPAVLAVVGLAVVLWTMYGAYSRLVELIGFAFLVAAAVLDWRARSTSRPAASEVSWIEAPELAEQLRGMPAPVVLDVRAADEFEGPLGHIAGAKNLPASELVERLTEIRALKNETVTLVCRTDRRSAAAAALLRGAGFADIRVLKGGMEGWNRNGLAIEREAAPE